MSKGNRHDVGFASFDGIHLQSLVTLEIKVVWIGWCNQWIWSCSVKQLEAQYIKLILRGFPQHDYLCCSSGLEKEAGKDRHKKIMFSFPWTWTAGERQCKDKAFQETGMCWRLLITPHTGEGHLRKALGCRRAPHGMSQGRGTPGTHRGMATWARAVTAASALC